MMLLKRLRKRLDERVEDAKAQQAESERRLAEAKVEVVSPLEHALVDNNFAWLIRQSLIEGHSGGKA
jgi:hypothetical protein